MNQGQTGKVAILPEHIRTCNAILDDIFKTHFEIEAATCRFYQQPKPQIKDDTKSTAPYDLVSEVKALADRLNNLHGTMCDTSSRLNDLV